MRLALCLCVVVVSLAGCDYAARWRDAQVAESHTLAQSDRISPPVSAPAKAADLADDLPVDKTWPVLEYSKSGAAVTAKLLSTTDAEQTTLFIDQRLRDMGYASGDNLSRILEGVTYSGKGRYAQIHVKVDMNSSEQVTVKIRGSR